MSMEPKQYTYMGGNGPEPSRPIPGFNGYAVNNHGKVFSKARMRAFAGRFVNFPARTLKGCMNHQGQRVVRLQREDKASRANVPVARLVAQLWIAPFYRIKMDRSWVVIHLDGNKSNCRANNLALVKRAEFNRHVCGPKGGRPPKSA